MQHRRLLATMQRGEGSRPVLSDRLAPQSSCARSHPGTYKRKPTLIMGYYRKIDVRIWSDESFTRMNPPQKLIWLCLLTHPLMTPLGAGVIYHQMLDEVLGNDGDWCYHCQELCVKHDECGNHPKGILKGFKEGSLILSEDHLIIIPKFLLYNMPQGPNQLAGWIQSCELLPRSPLFKELRDFLYKILNGEPKWLFLGLLDPLADQDVRGLHEKFWSRIEHVISKPEGRIKKGIKKGSKEASKSPRREQQQYQYQEQELLKRECPSSENGAFEFDQFWKSYPRKVGKLAAMKSFMKIKDRPSIDVILAAVEKAKQSEQWRKEHGQFIPNPATWLNQGRWDDNPVIATPKKLNRVAF